MEKPHWCQTKTFSLGRGIGGLDQGAVGLPSKHEVLSSNPSTAKKKKKDILQGGSLTYNFCLSAPGFLSLCGTFSCLCLPANFSGTCTLGHQILDVATLQNNQTIQVPH
jgi:hypothetical protein